MTEEEARGLVRIAAMFGDAEDLVALKQADPDLVKAALKDARKEWSRKRKPLLRWLRERVERYEQQAQ